MKNKSNKLLVLSLAALLGLAGCSSLPKGDESDKDEIGSSILVDEEGTQDEIGVAVSLKKAASSTASAKIGQYWGLQKIDGEDGKISVRFIAAVSGIDDIYSMYVKRSVVDKDGNSVMSEKTIAIDKVYKSLTEVEGVAWDGENSNLDSDVYYAVYTLKNIPEAHLNDEIDVEIGYTNWKGSTQKISVAANGFAFLHEATVIDGLKFEVGSSSNAYVKEDEVYVSASSTTLTEVNIPEKVYVNPYSYKKHVLQEATVVAIGNPNFSGYTYDGQGFYNCGKLTKITLPDTIRSFGPYVFQKCTALQEITLPENLTYVGKYAFGYNASYYNYACGLKRLIWNAKNLVPEDEYEEGETYYYGFISWSLDKLTVGPKVESIPNKKLFGGAAKATLPLEIEWQQTEAQRAALLAASPNSDFGEVENYLCSDTKKVSIAYHIGEGTLALNGEERTGDVTVQVYGQGRKLQDPGAPTPLSGKKFSGWFLDEGFANKASFPLVLGEDDVSLYAKYDSAAPGEVISNPKALAMDETFTFSTSEATPSNYFTFTADKEGSDYYYFEISDFVKAADSPNNRLSYETNIYIFSDSAFSKQIIPNRSAPLQSKVNGHDNYQVNVLLSQGESIYIQVAAFAINSTFSSPVYGDITLSTWTSEGDAVSEAKSIVKGTAESYAANKAHQDYIPTLYKFEAEQTGYSLSLAQLGTHNVRAYAYVYEQESGSRIGSFTLSGANSENLLTGLAVGKSYLIEVHSDYLSTFEEGDGVSILLGDLPAGLSEDNPIQGNLGQKQAITDLKAKTRYFSFHLEAGKTYHLIAWRYASSSSSSKPGCAYALSAPSGASLSSGKLFTSSYSDYGDITIKAAEDGVHILSADVVDSGTWSSTAHLSDIALIEEKSAFEESESFASGSILCVKASSKAIYDLTIASENGGSAKLTKLTYQFIASTNSSDTLSGEASITLSANTAVYYQATSEDGSAVVIKAEKAKAALEGKPYVGKEFHGGKLGSSSYWKMSIDEFGITSGESTFRNGVSVKEVGEENGIYHLSFTYSGVTTNGYTDGTRIYANCNGEEWFASSATTYSSAGVSFQSAKTSGYQAEGAKEGEVLIMSILEGSTRIYCLVKDSKVYLGASVEFASGTDISASGAEFSVKDAEGNSLGAFKTTASSTIVAA